MRHSPTGDSVETLLARGHKHLRRAHLILTTIVVAMLVHFVVLVSPVLGQLGLLSAILTVGYPLLLGTLVLVSMWPSPLVQSEEVCIASVEM